jgi:hypothetical protein
VEMVEQHPSSSQSSSKNIDDIYLSSSPTDRI